MDPSLLKQTEAFKRRALSNPVVEKRPKKTESEPSSSSSSRSKPTKKPKLEQPKASKGDFDYKASAGSSQYKFGILAKIVKHLKKKHQLNDMEPLNIDEILDETNQLDIGVRQRHWLVTEALSSNPKIEVVDGDKYRFKPVLNVHDRKGLLKLLIQHETEGLGGILLDEVEESVPNSSKVLRALGDQVMSIPRPIDKKAVLFYNNKDLKIPVDEELQKLWRSATVDGVDERNIEEYLQKHNITSMQDRILKKVSKKRKVASKKNRHFKAHNEHLSGVLQDYSEKK